MTDGSLDLASLETLTDFLIQLGVDGLVVLGVMGEAPKLSQREQDEVIETTVRAAAGRAPVFAGSGAEGTDLAVEKSLNALSLGASGLLVAPPPVQNDAVIYEYYRRIDAAVDSLIMLHDYPAATGIKLSPQLVAKLHAELEHVSVIKLEETPSAPKVSAIRALGSDISIVGGLGGMFFLEELERGSDGMMTGFSYPEVLVAIYHAYRSGKIRTKRADCSTELAPSSATSFNRASVWRCVKRFTGSGARLKMRSCGIRERRLMISLGVSLFQPCKLVV